LGDKSIQWPHWLQRHHVSNWVLPWEWSTRLCWLRSWLGAPSTLDWWQCHESGDVLGSCSCHGIQHVYELCWLHGPKKTVDCMHEKGKDIAIIHLKCPCQFCL
jgi:hypothetical protein